MPASVISQFIVIVGLLATGYACRKGGAIEDDGTRHLSKLLLYLTIPATSINAAIGQPIENLTLVLTTLGVSAAIFVAVPIVAHLLCRIFGWNDVYKLMLVFGNTGFVGIPVVEALWGSQNVFYVTLYIMVFNIAFFTWGVATMKRVSGYIEASERAGVVPDTRPGQRILKLLRDLMSPGVVSAVVALLIFCTQLPVPGVVHALIASVASLNSPLALVVIGASLANIPFRDVFTDASVYIFTALKLLVIPALTFVALWFTPIDRTLLAVFVTLAAMPVAGNVSMIAIQYGGDINLVSKATALTTLLFIPAVILWSSLLHAL